MLGFFSRKASFIVCIVHLADSLHLGLGGECRERRRSREPYNAGRLAQGGTQVRIFGNAKITLGEVVQGLALRG